MYIHSIMIGSKYNTNTNTGNRAIHLYMCKDRALVHIAIVCPVSDVVLVLGVWCLKPCSTLSIISWRSVLLVVESGENHRPVASILSEEYLLLVVHVEGTSGAICMFC